MKNLKTPARVQIVQFPHHSSCRLVKLFMHILKMPYVILHFTAQWWETIQCMCLWNLFCWAFPRINLYSTFTLCIFLHWKICQVELICYHRGHPKVIPRMPPWPRRLQPPVSCSLSVLSCRQVQQILWTPGLFLNSTFRDSL